MAVGSLAFMAACNANPLKKADTQKADTDSDIVLSPDVKELADKLSANMTAYGKVVDANAALGDAVKRDGSAVIILGKIQADKPSFCTNYESGKVQETLRGGRERSESFYITLFSLKKELAMAIEKDFPRYKVELKELTSLLSLGVIANEAVLSEAEDISDNITTVCKGWELLKDPAVVRPLPKWDI
ncbi:MAG: hypothetical protein RBR86_01665 [Pseudobdellovibrionaceae bacterium]|nr:hypothetical protein [Pseudobdellovibrionaceae bacterium]